MSMVSIYSQSSSHPWYRRITGVMIVCASTVIASDAPPAKLPRGFLEQLPLLMQLSKKEFELLLIYTEQNKAYNRNNSTPGDKNMQQPANNTSVNNKMGEYDED